MIRLDKETATALLSSLDLIGLAFIDSFENSAPETKIIICTPLWELIISTAQLQWIPFSFGFPACRREGSQSGHSKLTMTRLHALHKETLNSPRTSCSSNHKANAFEICPMIPIIQNQLPACAPEPLILQLEFLHGAARPHNADTRCWPMTRLYAFHEETLKSSRASLPAT